MICNHKRGSYAAIQFESFNSIIRKNTFNSFMLVVYDWSFFFGSIMKKLHCYRQNIPRNLSVICLLCYNGFIYAPQSNQSEMVKIANEKAENENAPKSPVILRSLFVFPKSESSCEICSNPSPNFPDMSIFWALTYSGFQNDASRCADKQLELR